MPMVYRAFGFYEIYLWSCLSLSNIVRPLLLAVWRWLGHTRVSNVFIGPYAASLIYAPACTVSSCMEGIRLHSRLVEA